MKKRSKPILLLIVAFLAIQSLCYSGWMQSGNAERLQDSLGVVKQFVFSPDGKMLYVLNNDLVLFKIDVETGKRLETRNFRDTLKYHYQLTECSLSKDGITYILVNNPAKNKDSKSISGAVSIIR
ncbi:MAG: hypothetical protein HW421_1603 [Ignavibacteria bacterium]|nr:hypothetical protein [Ignavibacteria bacterium]